MKQCKVVDLRFDYYQPLSRGDNTYGSVRVFVWFCESYVVHHLVCTGLPCVPLTCVVHHDAQGGPAHTAR